jgi:RNA polymerase sigma-70 factor (ECF subfamily)
MPDFATFENLVERFYAPLYQFALSLTHAEADACDLTQQTFTIWAAKGDQLRDASRVKSWLFTILHREFIASRRRQARFAHLEMDDVEPEFPAVSPAAENGLDADAVLATLAQVDELYQAPVAMFYLRDFSYLEIATALQIPLGTVKSRLARGIRQLQQLLSRDIATEKMAGVPQSHETFAA